MSSIDLREDAKTFRRELERTVSTLAQSDGPLCALEFGYDCDQGGWVFIHADRRDKHERDGEWTRHINDDNKIDFPHWVEAIESNFEGEEIELIKIDGTRLVIPAFDEENEPGDEEDGGPINIAVGEMIYDTVMTAKADDMFAPLKKHGAIQLDIEDFNGGWAWPEFDDLGQTNLV